MGFFSVISSMTLDFVPLPMRSIEHQYLAVAPLSAREFLELDYQAASSTDAPRAFSSSSGGPRGGCIDETNIRSVF
jgi:hypothetical protein